VHNVLDHYENNEEEVPCEGEKRRKRRRRKKRGEGGENGTLKGPVEGKDQKDGGDDALRLLEALRHHHRVAPQHEEPDLEEEEIESGEEKRTQR